MAVYLDVVWALNFLFDSLLLYLSAIFLKRDIRLWRVLAGGFIGSLIVLLSFTPYAVYSGHPASKFLCSIFMVLAAYGYKRWRYFINGLMTLYFSTFLIGGALIGIHYFIQNDNELTKEFLLASVKGFGDPISWLFILIGFPMAWHFSKKRVENLEMAKIQYDQLVEVKIQFNDVYLEFKGLIDSGNQLYDPISKMPVMFVSIRNQKELLPPEIKKIAEEAEPIIMGEKEIAPEWQNRLRIIPCKVVGKDHQLIAAVKPDSIVIGSGAGQFKFEKGLISFTMQQLSADDAYECIVHPKMLTGPKLPADSAKVS